MALRNNPTAAAKPVDNTPPFEAEDSETEMPASVTSVAPANDALAIAPASSDIVALDTRGSTLGKLQNALPVEVLESLGMGTFPRITVGLDGFSLDKVHELGKRITIEVLSWNYVWLITTGEQNNPEANKKIRTSYDGENLKDGNNTIDGYIAELKREGYDKAGKRQYGEIYCNLISSDVRGEVKPEDREIHQISVSPQSVAQWMGFMLSAVVRRNSLGIADSPRVLLTQAKKVNGPNAYGIIKFSQAK